MLHRNRSRTSARRAGVVLALALVASPAAVVAAPGDTASKIAAVGPVESAAASVPFMSEGVRVARRLPIVASGPHEVPVGQSFTIDGKVVTRSGGVNRARPVKLMQRIKGTWRLVSRKNSAKMGAFRFTVAGVAQESDLVFRVDAPKSRKLGAVRSALVEIWAYPPQDTDPDEPTEPPKEPPTSGDWDPAEYPEAGQPAPTGSETDWSYLFRGGSRWDPCYTIRWAYNPAGEYPGALDDMKRTFARISGITGLHFKYVGGSDHVPFSQSQNAPFPTNADFAVGWATEVEVPELQGWVVGLGGGDAMYADSADVTYEIYQGALVLDTEEVLRSGFDVEGSATWGQVMQHEVLHALGLGHATGRDQLMAGSVSSSNHRFGAGDLAGMEKIGAEPGCF